MPRMRHLALVALLAATFLAGARAAAATPLLQIPPPGLPQPQAVTLDPATTAILVIDLSTRCSNPQQVCREIVPGVARLLDAARARGVFITYTVSASARGTPLGDPWEGFNARPDEPVIYPDAFDKFYDGELQSLLAPRGITTLLITGSSTNVSVLYTSTAAARQYGYDVVIPIDGVNADTDYMQEYALYNLTVLPNVARNFRFTTLDQLGFTPR